MTAKVVTYSSVKKAKVHPRTNSKLRKAQIPFPQSRKKGKACGRAASGPRGSRSRIELHYTDVFIATGKEGT